MSANAALSRGNQSGKICRINPRLDPRLERSNNEIARTMIIDLLEASMQLLEEGCPAERRHQRCRREPEFYDGICAMCWRDWLLTIACKGAQMRAGAGKRKPNHRADARNQ